MLEIKIEWRDLRLLNEPFSSAPELLDNIGFSHNQANLGEVFLREKYLKEGLSSSQIAQESVSSESAVKDALAKFGIPRRTPHQHHGNPSQPKFGEKVSNGKLETHQAEKRVIDAIKALRAQGLTLREITDILDLMKIPTKQRGKKWHPEMVRRILKSIE